MNINQTTIYLCEDNPESIFTGIYLAWQDGTSHTDVRIHTTCDTLSFFETYKQVSTDTVLAEKVIRSIREKLSEEVYYYVFRACLSSAPDKTTHLYHFLQKAFRIGPSIVHCLQDEDVNRIFELTRNVRNEAHHFNEFVRFEEITTSILISRINPQNNVLPLICEHFADRLHCENWIILDTTRQLAAVHRAHKGYILTNSISEKKLLNFSIYTEKEQQYKDLWNIFFHSIAIQERNNTKLQRNMMPLRFRKYMDAENRP